MANNRKTDGSAVFDKKRFGAFLKASRRTRGLSQPELAARAEVSNQVISNLETGRVTPTIDTLCQLASAIGISPQDLLEAGIRGRTGNRPPEVDRIIEILAGFNSKETQEAIAILEAVERLRA